jgi:hypothetical protein
MTLRRISSYLEPAFSLSPEELVKTMRRVL